MATNAISEYQSSVKMATLKRTVHDEAYEEAVEAFVYTTGTRHLDWDLAYLGAHLADQIAEWRADMQAIRPPSEERPIRSPFPIIKPPIVLPPPSEVLLKQVIECN